MRAGVARGRLISPVLFVLYVNDMPSPSNHVELALCADDTAIIATFRKPTLLVIYLESYLTDLQQWLSEWRIAIDASKSTAIIFAACRTVLHPAPTSNILRGTNPIGRHNSLSGVILHTRLTWSPHIDQIRKRVAQTLVYWVTSWIERAISPSGTESCYISSSSAPW